MSLSPPERALILKDLKTTGWDFTRVARMYGVTIQFLQREFYTEAENLKTPGNPRLAKHLVSLRTVDSDCWPERDAVKIDQARADYDAGKVEMCQGKADGFFLLYAIPRKVLASRRQFFSGRPLEV
jgi:hypothetical protein